MIWQFSLREKRSVPAAVAIASFSIPAAAVVRWQTRKQTVIDPHYAVQV
jgi:hypothetical protein